MKPHAYVESKTKFNAFMQPCCDVCGKMRDAYPGIHNELAVDELTTLRTRLQQVESERDQYKHEAEMWDEHMGPLTDYEGDEAPWQTIVREFESLRDERDRAEADAAVKCRALEYCYLHNHYGPLDRHHERYNCVFCETVVNALATNAGKSLLERLQEAERLLSRAHPGMHTCETSQWFTDRDTFLNPKPQDVM